MAGVMSWLVGAGKLQLLCRIFANGKIQVVTMASWHDPAHTQTWIYMEIHVSQYLILLQHNKLDTTCLFVEISSD